MTGTENHPAPLIPPRGSPSILLYGSLAAISRGAVVSRQVRIPMLLTHNRRIKNTMQNRLIPIALGALLAVGTAGAALAQDNPPPDQNQAGPPADAQRGRGMRMDPDRALARLTRELNLTSDQQNQIKPLLVERQQKIQALFQDQSLAPEDRRRQARTISEGTHNSIKALLNDDQKQKFDAMQERMRRNGPAGGPGGPPPSPDSSTPPPQL